MESTALRVRTFAVFFINAAPKRILDALSEERSVLEIAKFSRMRKTEVSRILNEMRPYGIVESRFVVRTKYYRLNEDRMRFYKELMEIF